MKKCTTSKEDGEFHPFQSGMIYRVDSDALYIAVRGGTILIREVLDEKGRDIFNKMSVGNRFYTPTKALEEAKMFRAVYTAEGLVKGKKS